MQGGQRSGYQWSRGVTAQGTQRKMSSSVCVFSLWKRSIEPPKLPNRSPIRFHCRSHLQEPAQKGKWGACWRCWRGGSRWPIKPRALSPILIPNHSQDKASCPRHPSPTGHTEDVKQQTSTCPPRYRPAQTGSHCMGRQLRLQPLTASLRQGGGHTSAPYHATAARRH